MMSQMRLENFCYCQVKLQPCFFFFKTPIFFFFFFVFGAFILFVSRIRKYDKAHTHKQQKEKWPQLSTSAIMKLNVGGKIDFRMSNNKFIACKITNKSNDNVCYLQPLEENDEKQINKDELQFKQNDSLWVKNDGLKIARWKSISRYGYRNRLHDLKMIAPLSVYVRSMVTQNSNDNPEFVLATFIGKDEHSQQIEVLQQKLIWVDINNVDEISSIPDFINQQLISN